MRLDIATPRVFQPLLKPARYKGVWGGRGSGKSHFFAELLMARALVKPGLRAVCIREVQKTLDQSVKRLIEDKIAHYQAPGFEPLRSEIRTPGDGIITFQGMQDHNADSIKSLEGFDIAWVEEAQSLSARSMELLRPTIRAPGSELWFSWNPRRKNDPVDVMFRGGEPPTGSVVVRANWESNKRFPKELEQERLDCLRDNPSGYGHIWEGDYASIATGAYYAEALARARLEKRIGSLIPDPLLPYRAIWDIGVRDATAIWIAQFVGREIWVMGYYEAVGQPLSTHVEWLRSKGYGHALCVLPHDGAQADAVTAIRYEDHLRSAGFDVQTIPNQGRGAAMKRVETARRLFPRIRFHADNCAAGLDALGWYHEKRDEARNVGLGPEHDWASHGADAFGLMCVAYDAPDEGADDEPAGYGRGSGWMSA